MTSVVLDKMHGSPPLQSQPSTRLKGVCLPHGCIDLLNVGAYLGKFRYKFFFLRFLSGIYFGFTLRDLIITFVLETAGLFQFYSKGFIFYFYLVSHGPRRRPEGMKYEPIKISLPSERNLQLSQHDPKTLANKPQIFQLEST